MQTSSSISEHFHFISETSRSLLKHGNQCHTNQSAFTFSFAEEETCRVTGCAWCNAAGRRHASRWLALTEVLQTKIPTFQLIDRASWDPGTRIAHWIHQLPTKKQKSATCSSFLEANSANSYLLWCKAAHTMYEGRIFTCRLKCCERSSSNMWKRSVLSST